MTYIVAHVSSNGWICYMYILHLNSIYTVHVYFLKLAGGRNAFAVAAAAAARTSRLVAPSVEENMGSIGWWVGSGIVPTGGGSVAPLARGERAGNRDNVWVCPMGRRSPSCRRLTQTFALCTVQYICYLSLEQASQHYCECSVPD